MLPVTAFRILGIVMHSSGTRAGHVVMEGRRDEERPGGCLGGWDGMGEHVETDGSIFACMRTTKILQSELGAAAAAHADGKWRKKRVTKSDQVWFGIGFFRMSFGPDGGRGGRWTGASHGHWALALQSSMVTLLTSRHAGVFVLVLVLR